MTAEEYYQKGREFANKYNDEAALVCYDVAIELNPDFDKAYNNRGIIKKEMKLYNAAKQDFDRAIELNPLNINAYLNRAMLKNFSLENENPKEDFDKALEIDPDNVDALCDRGYFYYALGLNYDAALCDIEKAIAVAPDRSSGYYYRGLIAMQQSQWKATIADFNQSIVIEYGTENYKAYAFRANAKIKLKQYASALQDLNRFVALSPKTNQSKLDLFDKPKNINWLEQGREFFRRSRQYNDEASMQEKMSCILLAKECFEKVLRINKPLIDYRETLAFGAQVIDCLIECKRNEKDTEKCPECGGSLIYCCADTYCETCGLWRCR
jgi:tetratricopeptide (TPR) repeat protein